jgi:hypothetical protein
MPSHARTHTHTLSLSVHAYIHIHTCMWEYTQCLTDGEEEDTTAPCIDSMPAEEFPELQELGINTHFAQIQSRAAASQAQPTFGPQATTQMMSTNAQNKDQAHGNLGLLAAQQPVYVDQFGYLTPQMMNPRDASQAPYTQQLQYWQQQQPRMFGASVPGHFPILDPTSLMTQQERAFFASIAASQ